MPKSDKPIERHNRPLIMDLDDEDFDGEDYVFVDGDDLAQVEVEVPPVFISLTSDDDSDSEDDRVMSCDPSTDHATTVFSKHEGSVFCIGVNPADENVIVTGGQDDKLFVWHAFTRNVLLEHHDFSDSVSHANFNHDGKFLAAVNMDGTIIVWKCHESEFSIVWEIKISDIQWMTWHPQANVMLVGEASGSVYMWKIPSGECKVLPGHAGLTDVGAFMPDGRRAVVCYVDGSVKIFDLSTTAVTEKYDKPESSQVFISMDVHPDNNLVAVGSVNSQLCILKTQGTKSFQQYPCIEPHEREEGTVSTTVECIAFSRKLPYNVVIAATDNALHIIDYVKSEVRGYLAIEEGVTRLVWPEGSHLVFVGTKVGRIAVCDVRAINRVMTLEGHRQSILDIVITAGGKTLISASDDNTARVFELDKVFAAEGLPNPF